MRIHTSRRCVDVNICRRYKRRICLHLRLSLSHPTSEFILFYSDKLKENPKKKMTDLKVQSLIDISLSCFDFKLIIFKSYFRLYLTLLFIRMNNLRNLEKNHRLNFSLNIRTGTISSKKQLRSGRINLNHTYKLLMTIFQLLAWLIDFGPMSIRFSRKSLTMWTLKDTIHT